MRKRSGQAFILGSIIFSLFMLLAFTSTGPSVSTSATNTQNFFSQTLGESSEAFNDALTQNESSQHVKRRMQAYDRFVERKSKERGVTYDTYHLILLPGKGEAVFTNLANEDLDTRLKVDGGWTNQTVSDGQSFSTSFSTGTVSVDLVIDNRDESYSLDAATPKLVKHSVMESEDERWENTLVG